MSLNILLLEDVHASATPILSALPAAEVVRLKHAPGAEEVNLVFYDTTPKREYINSYPIRAKATAKIILSEVDLRPEDGFKPGNKYQVLITRLINGKEEVYARTSLELK